MEPIVNVLIGIPLLIWGRKLFWLFVGAVGFIVGFGLAQRFMPGQEQGVQLLIGAAIGIVGVMLALVIQKLALTVTGFLAGAYLTMSLMQNLGASLGPWNWIVYLVGGMIGSILILSVFDWALIILSSMVGAALISQTSFQMIELDLAPRTVVFIALLIIGLLVQADQKRRDK